MPSTSVITLKNASFGYRAGRLALQDISLEIPRGSRVAFIGPNGAGKSTLFLHLNAILRPTSGQLLYDGSPYDYSRAGTHRLRRQVGLVFQDHDSQLFAANVLDDVLFGPMNMGMSLARAEETARESLSTVGMLELADEPVHFLSPGQKKRVAIAGVLAMNPDVLVMDEPTAGLDYTGMVNFELILTALHATGKTLIVSTHDMDWAWKWADLAFVMAEGRIVLGGEARGILARDDHAAYGFARPCAVEQK